MANYISLRGFVSSDITMSTTETGLVIGKFRMGSNTRQRDPVTNQWVDGKTNWFQVTAFRTLATNAMISIHKGNRIVVMGKLNVTSYLRKDGTPGNGVEIEADSIGLDLNFGTVTYHRMRSANQSYDATSGNPAGGSLQPNFEEGEFPPDEPADTVNHVDGDDEDAGQGDSDDDDLKAAEGLQSGEHADEQTGEILVSSAPF
ncbi:single-stranded DNA-binding protein [Specibacter sp. NPDC078692]|uniref:single-stranded DNA-binding protein n=1 Tax=Specibacter sp. NPDC078692 TaxID=3155818 RepID=UPI003438BD1F